MIKIDSFVAALAVSTALFLVIGVTVPSRALAQTPGQGQALGILLLLGLGARPGAQPPAQDKKSDGVANKAARAPGKLVAPNPDRSNGRTVGRSAEVADGSRARLSGPRPAAPADKPNLLAATRR